MRAFDVVGVCPRRRLATCPYSPSDFYTGEEEFVPSDMDWHNVWRGLSNATGPKWLLSGSEMSYCYEVLEFWIRPWMRTEVISYSAAVDRLDLSKNPGPPFHEHCMTKGQSLEMFEMEKLVEDFRKQNGHVYLYATLKAELRELAKVLEGKTRLFMPLNVVGVLVGNELFAIQNDSLNGNVMKHPITIGIQVPGREITQLFLDIPEGWTIYTFDVSQMDMRMNLGVLMAVAVFRLEGFVGEDLSAAIRWYDETLFGSVSILGWMVRVFGQKSGTTVTAHDNSMATLCCLCLAWRALTGLSLHAMRAFVYPKVNGDDGMYAVDNRFVDQFNVKAVAEYFRQHLGVRLETPTTGTVDRTKVTYLSRTLVLRRVSSDGGSYWMTRPNVEKLVSSFSFIRGDSMVDQLSKYLNLLVMLYPVEEVYKSWKGKIISWCVDHDDGSKDFGNLFALVRDERFALWVNLGVLEGGPDWGAAWKTFERCRLSGTSQVVERMRVAKATL